MNQLSDQIRSAQIVVPCTDLNAMLDFFIERIGFRVEMIFPADSPTVAVISGYGITLRFETADEVLPSNMSLRLLCDSLEDEIIAPNGMRIEFAKAQTPLEIPSGTNEFVINKMTENAWNVGRANMEYRDLIPNRLGGRFIASHIRIPHGGEVPDYVHFHKVRFQMIFCKQGWAKLVYEDQGEPFIFSEGDCVLQPPEIRHRVLEASDMFEVIEIGCPAIHETFADHNLLLPTSQILPERIFSGQKFVRHIANQAIRQTQNDGFSFRDTGISEATNGLANVRILQSNSKIRTSRNHNGEFLFYFVLNGELEINNEILKTGDSCVIPAKQTFNLKADETLEMLEVSL
jgi:mannose-6-phosphate isomerase-like protein (cupin superfamily)